MTSRRKDRHYENQFAKRYGGARISETGLPGPDVQLTHLASHGTTTSTKWEIKYRTQMAALNWWDQAVKEGADYLAIRRPNDTNYYIIHPVNKRCPCPLPETKQEIPVTPKGEPAE